MIEPTIKQLNELTNASLISDLAVTWADVAECDRVKALAYLESKKSAEQQEMF